MHDVCKMETFCMILPNKGTIMILYVAKRLVSSSKFTLEGTTVLRWRYKKLLLQNTDSILILDQTTLGFY